MEKRLGFVGIVVENRKQSAGKINDALTGHGDIIVGRMGLPHLAHDTSVITLIVNATTDEVGTLTGKLGMIDGVSVKSAMSKVSVTDKK
ncbi:MAG TPA: iron-only hydrogenase system regulator [Kiritimatiellia bacterium]|nr:iron-only hydrogenase system regulator [Kiritimatiellia bacterium]